MEKNIFLAEVNKDITISSFCKESFSDDINYNNKLTAMNFGIGSVIRIVQKHKNSIIIAKNNSRLIISKEIASKIFYKS